MMLAQALMGQNPQSPQQPQAAKAAIKNSSYGLVSCVHPLPFTESQHGRGWKGPLWVTQSRLHRTASRRGLNISREGDSTASLGSLGQGFITLRLKKFFLMFSWSFLCFSLCLLLLVLSLGTTEQSLALSS